MTDKMRNAVRECVHETTTITAVTITDAPPSIQGHLDIATCLAGLIRTAKTYAHADAILIGCFDDTGVEAVRCLTNAPVIGIGEAAYHSAAMIAPKFGVVTTLSRSVTGLEANLHRYGLAHRCTGVRASDVSVLALEAMDETSLNAIRAEITAALDEDKAEAIVLGCAGMTDLMHLFEAEFGVPVVDGVKMGATLLEAFYKTGLKTSHYRTYRA